MTTLPLDTAPGPSPDEEAVRNAGISAELLEKAWAELAAGDLLQASEKAWGAAAWAIKTVAERRRWFSEADWKLHRAVTVFAEELGKPGACGLLCPGPVRPFQLLPPRIPRPGD